MQQQFVVGADGRYYVANTTTYYARTFAKMSQNCTATMIGRSTALTAAHCVYQQAVGWIATDSISFGANNTTTSYSTITTPFGSYVFDSVTFPSGWFGDNWEWDFAVLEFSPTRYPGDTLGWMGTVESKTGYQYILGYPMDGLTPWHTPLRPWSQWGHGDVYGASVGFRYEHTIDMASSDSEACIFNASLKCTGINSTQKITYSPARVWNEARRWDAATHGFFDTYGNWP